VYVGNNDDAVHAEQDTESIKEQDIPHVEKHLPNNNERQHTTSAHVHTGVVHAHTYLNREAVSEEGKEPQEEKHREVDGELDEVCHKLRHALRM
jgi:hypothetical protein